MPYTPEYVRFAARLNDESVESSAADGYDVTSIAAMRTGERKKICELLRERPVTWREVEALAAIDLPSARAAVEAALGHPTSIDTRLAAAEAMHVQGRLPDFDAFLAKEIRALSSAKDVNSRAFVAAQRHPSEKVKQALLWASLNCTDCSSRCAAALCYVCGVTKEPFDPALQPLFVRLGKHESYFTRKKAFDELCKLVKMELDADQGN